MNTATLEAVSSAVAGNSWASAIVMAATDLASCPEHHLRGWTTVFDGLLAHLGGVAFDKEGMPNEEMNEGLIDATDAIVAHLGLNTPESDSDFHETQITLDISIVGGTPKLTTLESGGLCPHLLIAMLADAIKLVSLTPQPDEH